MASVQRLMMYLTPIWLLDLMSRICPRTVIGLLCHWVNEKNPNLEERQITPRRPNPLPVAKKFSKLSMISILNLLRQDEALWKLKPPKKSLWKYYSASERGGSIIPLPTLPYILLELIYDLGGSEGREKVKDVVHKSRTTIGSAKQADILENFKIDTVLDIFEDFEKTKRDVEIRMRLKFSNPQAVAVWLTHWDLRMEEIGLPPKSNYWIAQLDGKRAFDIEKIMKDLEFRRKWADLGKEYLSRAKTY